MSNEMIERVAKAIDEATEYYAEPRRNSGMCDVYVIGSDEYVTTFSTDQEAGAFVANFNSASRARAAIEAMRKPTEAMVDAGGIAYPLYGGSDEAFTELYSAMIDAALKEGDTTPG